MSKFKQPERLVDGRPQCFRRPPWLAGQIWKTISTKSRKSWTTPCSTPMPTRRLQLPPARSRRSLASRFNSRRGDSLDRHELGLSSFLLDRLERQASFTVQSAVECAIVPLGKHGLARRRERLRPNRGFAATSRMTREPQQTNRFKMQSPSGRPS
jgi:hypothetical protein